MCDAMEEQSLLKKKLRRKYKTCGAALTAEYRAFADCAIYSLVQQSEAWQSAKRIFIYVSMWAEPDTRALIGTALREGKSVYVPLCCPDRVMKAVHIMNPDELRPGTLGIPEPPADGEAAQPGSLDLAIVPCITATADGARLGHGAGYYDRFLRLHACPALCLCYGQMLADELPMDENDIWMDGVATEAGITGRLPDSSGLRL